MHNDEVEVVNMYSKTLLVLATVLLVAGARAANYLRDNCTVVESKLVLQDDTPCLQYLSSVLNITLETVTAGFPNDCYSNIIVQTRVCPENGFDHGPVRTHIKAIREYSEKQDGFPCYGFDGIGSLTPQDAGEQKIKVGLWADFWLLMRYVLNHGNAESLAEYAARIVPGTQSTGATLLTELFNKLPSNSPMAVHPDNSITWEVFPQCTLNYQLAKDTSALDFKSLWDLTTVVQDQPKVELNDQAPPTTAGAPPPGNPGNTSGVTVSGATLSSGATAGIILAGFILGVAVGVAIAMRASIRKAWVARTSRTRPLLDNTHPVM